MRKIAADIFGPAVYSKADRRPAVFDALMLEQGFHFMFGVEAPLSYDRDFTMSLDARATELKPNIGEWSLYNFYTAEGKFLRVYCKNPDDAIILKMLF